MIPEYLHIATRIFTDTLNDPDATGHDVWNAWDNVRAQLFRADDETYPAPKGIYAVYGDADYSWVRPIVAYDWYGTAYIQDEDLMPADALPHYLHTVDTNSQKDA